MKSVNVTHCPNSVYLVIKDGVKIIVESFSELKHLEKKSILEV